MDWARAIERNSETLQGIVLSLFAMLGLDAGAPLGRISRALHASVLRLLRPAESAVRRLIVVAARGLMVKPRPSRPMPAGRRIAGKGGGARAFQLFDPRKRFDQKLRRKGPRVEPRIHFWPYDTLTQRSKPPAPPEDVDAKRLCLRLEALKLALADLPHQAKRLVRARARRAKVPRLQLQSVMRPGRPPGYRKVPIHEVDHVLAECHWLARDVEAYDTS